VRKRGLCGRYKTGKSHTVEEQTSSHILYILEHRRIFSYKRQTCLIANHVMRNFTRFFKSKFEVVFPRLSQKQKKFYIRKRGGAGKC
jgi:hypothetical protein